MSQRETFDVIILWSGQGGKRLAWYLGKSGKRVAAVERRFPDCGTRTCLRISRRWSSMSFLRT